MKYYRVVNGHSKHSAVVCIPPDWPEGLRSRGKSPNFDGEMYHVHAIRFYDAEGKRVSLDGAPSYRMSQEFLDSIGPMSEVEIFEEFI